MKHVMWWATGTIALGAIVLVTFLGTRGGTWQTVRDGPQTATIPRNWNLRQVNHGEQIYFPLQNHDTCLWLVFSRQPPFSPGNGAKQISSPQPGMMEWQVSTTQHGIRLVNFYGVFHQSRQYCGVHIMVPAHQLALGSQILGSWQPNS